MHETSVNSDDEPRRTCDLSSPFHETITEGRAGEILFTLRGEGFRKDGVAHILCQP
jgi:hypothetical protein